jgi:hypothetical protein
LSFFKYIGYLAFPIQMAYRYPDLARFMAGHWATGAVHVVPVFGERGALLEHAVFDLFYNYPLTVRRRLRQRQDRRSGLRRRTWHVVPVTIGGLGILLGIEALYRAASGHPAAFREVWWAGIWVPILCAGAVTAWAGGASLGARLGLAAAGNIALAALYAMGSAVAADRWMNHPVSPSPIGALISGSASEGLWLAFIFTMLAVVTVLVAETRRLRPSPFNPALSAEP